MIYFYIGNKGYKFAFTFFVKDHIKMNKIYFCYVTENMWTAICYFLTIGCIYALSSNSHSSNLHSQSVPPLFGSPQYFYPLPHTDDVSVLLSIKGKREARVWLCPEVYPMNETVLNIKSKQKRLLVKKKVQKGKKVHGTPCDAGIEVLFGSTSNQYITIRDHWYIIETSTFIAPLYHGNVLDHHHFRPFWINWKNNELTVGFGYCVYKQVILAYREDASSSGLWMKQKSHTYGLSRIAFSSWEEPIHFIFYIQMAVRHPYPTFSTSSEYEQFGQYKTILHLSTKQFQVIIECQGLSECNMAFLRSYLWRTEDSKAIEIVLHDAFERRHLYSRNIMRYGTGLGGTILSESNQTVLSSSQCRPFWIDWDSDQFNTSGLITGRLRIGKGIIFGENILLSATTFFSTPFVYMGFSNYFLATSIRILYASSNNSLLYSFNRDTYQQDTSSESPLTFSYGTDSINRGFIASHVKQQCPRMTRCEPPSSLLYPFGVSLRVTPRIQWWHHGAYCAEVSIQTVLLGKGIYFSQAWIRKHSPYSGSRAFFGDNVYGYEIVPGNIQQALQQLGVSYKVWNGTDSRLFFEWIKRNIVGGRPIVWFIQSATSSYVEHAEPVVGYHSRFPLHHKRVYPSDMIRYHNNIELLSYYRRVDSFVDKGIDKNCTRGISFGTECVSPLYQFGIAIHGIKGIVQPLPITVDISINDGGMEDMQPKWIYTMVTISHLTIGKEYILIRYTKAGNKICFFFEANHHRMVWKDDKPIRSNSFIYYRVSLVK